MKGYLYFSLYRQREVSKRELVARFVSEGISTLRTELRDSLRSNRSSLRLRRRSQSLHSLADTFAIATFYTLVITPLLGSDLGLTYGF